MSRLVIPYEFIHLLAIASRVPPFTRLDHSATHDQVLAAVDSALLVKNSLHQLQEVSADNLQTLVDHALTELEEQGLLREAAAVGERIQRLVDTNQQNLALISTLLDTLHLISVEVEDDPSTIPHLCARARERLNTIAPSERQEDWRPAKGRGRKPPGRQGDGFEVLLASGEIWDAHHEGDGIFSQVAEPGTRRKTRPLDVVFWRPTSPTPLNKPTSYAELLNAFQMIQACASTLPTFNAVDSPSVTAVAERIVTALTEARLKLEAQ